MRKKILGVVLGLSLSLSLLTGCTDSSSSSSSTSATEDANKGSEDDSKGNLVGVAMPSKALQRWNQDGSNMKSELETAGYEVDLQYASDEIGTQVSQIETMISNGCNLLVIASIDGDSLGTVLEQAKEAKIPVIAYDRLIMNSDAVSYYATFDNYKVGTVQGQYIEEKLDLKNADGPFNLEVFTGDPGDNNAKFFYNGAMDVLNPYIESGKLVIQSSQKDFAEVATSNWSTETAQSRMENILSSYYADGKKIDAVLCSNDSTALGVTNALEANYTGDWPIITGQDCDIANVKNMINGKQSMSIFKDTRELAKKTVEMVKSIMEGGEAPVNDEKSYDNGTGVIPTYLCDPVYADKENYQKLLVESGYYKDSDLD